MWVRNRQRVRSPTKESANNGYDRAPGRNDRKFATEAEQRADKSVPGASGWGMGQNVDIGSDTDQD